MPDEKKVVKVYLASPFFNEKQIKYRDLVMQYLLDNWEEKIYLFSPQHQGGKLSLDANEEERKAIFTENVEEIEKADLIVAITTDKDPGTIWESGCAWRARKPIIYINFDVKVFNVMLGRSGIAVCTDLNELCAAIKQFLRGDLKYGADIHTVQHGVE